MLKNVCRLLISFINMQINVPRINRIMITASVIELKSFRGILHRINTITRSKNANTLITIIHVMLEKDKAKLLIRYERPAYNITNAVILE